ncbi:hypothetical protein DPMN_154208 [Dreissena polymorpha]|uniref:Uncharacterized protein n=1 Tax=Dreissena polymorpha TaxID=45954 RepID=A0A9D4FK06_DREPO|nr:hypothetical protein DPMN_154208 [Dreissena polymorpha]
MDQPTNFIFQGVYNSLTIKVGNEKLCQHLGRDWLHSGGDVMNGRDLFLRGYNVMINRCTCQMYR